MTPRQFGVLQHLDRDGWVPTPSLHVAGQVLAMLERAGLIERATRRLVGVRKPLDVAGWQITEAGEAALVAENLRLLKEVADPGIHPPARPFIVTVPRKETDG